MLNIAFPATLIIQLIIAIINHVSVSVASLMLMLQADIESNVGIGSITEIYCRNNKTLRLDKEPPLSQ